MEFWQGMWDHMEYGKGERVIGAFTEYRQGEREGKVWGYGI
jgi:hypothetical protein